LREIERERITLSVEFQYLISGHSLGGGKISFQIKLKAAVLYNIFLIYYDCSGLKPVPVITWIEMK
jgi:hypothetical protein